VTKALDVGHRLKSGSLGFGSMGILTYSRLVQTIGKVTLPQLIPSVISNVFSACNHAVIPAVVYPGSHSA
jgi:hypothetical protein